MLILVRILPSFDASLNLSMELAPDPLLLHNGDGRPYLSYVPWLHRTKTKSRTQHRCCPGPV